MRILVIGGTGTVGSRTVEALRSEEAQIRCMTRSQETAADLPEGIEGAVGDLARPETLPAALNDVDRVFLITPLDPRETELGLAGVEAAVDAGVDRIVYLSVAMPEGSEDIPHFASKIPIEEAVRDAGVAWAVLRPNNFFQNDLWLREAIVEHGVYPQPIGPVGLNRVDVGDIAAVAVRALTGDGVDGEIPVHGPAALTGPGIAETWSRHLDSEVSYAGDDLDAWAENAGHMMPEWMVHDLRIMYAFFQEHGFRASDEELSRLRDVLGRPPRSFDDFAAETAARWRD